MDNKVSSVLLKGDHLEEFSFKVWDLAKEFDGSVIIVAKDKTDGGIIASTESYSDLKELAKYFVVGLVDVVENAGINKLAAAMEFKAIIKNEINKRFKESL